MDQPGDGLPPPPRRDRNQRSLCLMRLDQDERATGQERLPCSFEGMDHALDCDSSKRPTEERNLEWLATSPEPFG
jgi:hypothetical protein